MGMLLAPINCGTVLEQAILSPTSYWFVMILSTLASSFPVTRSVTSSVTIGVRIIRPRTSVQHPMIPNTRAWPLTPMVLIHWITALLVSVCAKCCCFWCCFFCDFFFLLEWLGVFVFLCLDFIHFLVCFSRFIVVLLFVFVCLFGGMFWFLFLFCFFVYSCSCLFIVVIVFGLFFIVCVLVHNREKSFVLLSYATHELRNQNFPQSEVNK